MKMKHYMPLPELLAGLAEEACELGQAALKLRRVYDGTNPTPKSEQEAIDELHEEIADVMLYLDQITYHKNTVNAIKAVKLERWERRIEYGRKQREAAK